MDKTDTSADGSGGRGRRPHGARRDAPFVLRADLVRLHLDRLVRDFHRPESLPYDPVGMVRRFERDCDQEVAGLVAALLAYGRVASIQANVGRVLTELGGSPARALDAGRHRERGFAAGFQHRWTTRADLRGLLTAIAWMRREDGGLGLGLQRRVEAHRDFGAGLRQWVVDLREAAGPASRSRSFRFLLPDPGGNGASKRLHLFLRWMIRPDDGIDPGTWSHLLPAAGLVLPLDTHWARIGPRLGWTRRKHADARMARELTEALRRIDAVDPLRYDFTICHVGIQGHCPTRLERRHCEACPLAPICATGQRRLVTRARAGTASPWRPRSDGGSPD